MATNAAIIVAAGSSRRMGFDKLMARLGGLSVLQRSILACEACEQIDLTIVVTDEIRFAKLDRSLFRKNVLRVDGGSERQNSVQNGLAALINHHPELVAVHDGARPLVSPEAISLAIAAAKEHGAASLARPVADTLKRATEDQFAGEPVDRSQLWAMETPQCFRLDLLREAYQQITARQIQVTDEVSALQHIGHPVKLVGNPAPNPKITYPQDLEVAELLLHHSD